MSVVRVVFHMLVATTVLAAGPALAKWHYCYDGATPEGVNVYTEMPPRNFGFEFVLLPATFKRLCGLPADTEAAHVRRLVAEALECPPDSDLALRIDAVLTAAKTEALARYFGASEVPGGPHWDAVCQAAARASVARLAFGDTWYFDSADAALDKARLVALTDALEALTLHLAAQSK